MEYNEMRTAAEPDERNSRTSIPDAGAGNTTAGDTAVRDKENNMYAKADVGASGLIIAEATANAAGEATANAADETTANAAGETTANTVGKTIDETTVDSGGEICKAPDDDTIGNGRKSTVSTPGRASQNKRKIDREEILRQASEPAMRAEKMADSILHIRSAAEFLTERYIPQDKRSYSAESFREGYCETAQQGVADGAPDGGLIDTAAEVPENSAESTSENARLNAPGVANGNAPGIANGNASDVVHGNASDVVHGNASGNMANCMQDGVRGNPAYRKMQPTRSGDTNAGISADANADECAHTSDSVGAHTSAHTGTDAGAHIMARTIAGTSVPASAHTGIGISAGTGADVIGGTGTGTSTHVSAGKSNTAGRTANGATGGREIPPLAVPVDFSTLGFPQASADEPVAPDECRIIVLRHAQSLGNAKGSFLGHTDLDLTEQGFIQAEMAADFLDATHIHIDKIYSSDLMRAFHTALPSARRRGLLLSTTKELREVYMGKWEGRVVAELDAEYPEEFGIGWRQHFGTCVLPEGESVPHAARRVYDFVVSRAKENLGKTVMFTSHAAAIRSFWGLASGVPFGRMAEEVPFPGNASFSTMLWKSDGQGDGSLTPCEFSIDGYLGDLRQIKHS